MKEQLKEIKGCKGYYISETGYVVDKNGKNIKKHISAYGREYIHIRNKKNSFRKNLEILVAEHFLRKPPYKKYIKHKDGVLINNNKNNLQYSYQPEFSLEAIERRKKRFRIYMGKNHWKSRPFTIDGQKFYTLKEATYKAGTTCLDTIKKRLVNPNMKNYKYCE